MAKVGRNDPCPCGSGRKYKKCCLLKTVSQPGFTSADRDAALAMLDAFVANEMVEEDEAAYGVFYEDIEDRLEDIDSKWVALSEAVYHMWFQLDEELADGSLVVDRFLSRHPLIGSGIRQYLERLRETAMRLYEVVDVSPGESVTLRDVISGPTITVREQLGSRSFSRHMLLAARVIPQGPSGRPEMESGLVHLPDLIRRQTVSQLASHLKEFRREHPRSSETDFYKGMAPFFHDAWISCILDPPIPRMANTDGENMVMTASRFDVLDPAGLQTALNRAKELDRAEEGCAWEWYGENKEGKRILLGSLVLKGKTLELQCNSVQREERGRALLEALAGSQIHHRATVHQNIEKDLRERVRRGDLDDSGETDDLPREVKEAVTLDALGRHYREWLDMPIPALEEHTPRDAAAHARLRPKLADLIRQLEGAYQDALKNGDPAYDPSWMWRELGFEDRSKPANMPPLAHERVGAMVPGVTDLCRSWGAHMRGTPGLSETSATVPAERIGTDLQIQSFLRSYRSREADEGDSVSPDADTLAAHIEYMLNFELNLRKTFWVDGPLSYMLAKTDLGVPGSDLRLPFACFALVFTDRYVLSLAERMLSTDPQSPLSGHFLRIITVYITEVQTASGRVLRLWFALDALGADPPYLITQEILLNENAPIQLLPEEPVPLSVDGVDIPDANPLRGLLHVTLNAILYATSPGIEQHHRKNPTQGTPASDSELYHPLVSSEEVFFLPGAIEISHFRSYQELERIPSGRRLLHRFMVRGHWRRASSGWKDQRMRWIAPYWKGPDIAAIIERTYKLKK